MQSELRSTPLKVLLLQGPIGPFFKSLHESCLACGFEVKHVLFNQADRLFALNKGQACFSGSRQEWAAWLTLELKNNRPDIIILFGSSRPAHRIARRLATQKGIKILSLEEGYLRSGYITCELDGNNQFSPLRHWQPSDLQPKAPTQPLDIKSSFLTMCLWGALYYFWRQVYRKETDVHLYHRKTEGLIKEIFRWINNSFCRTKDKFCDASTIKSLCSDQSGSYVLVPLQTPSDYQIRTAANGWTNERLIENSISAFAKSGTKGLMVLKTHPLDETPGKTHAFIETLTRKHQCHDRVIILHSGQMGELTKHSSGMILINSTSGFSALHHGAPLLVMGEAVYRHESIVTVGKTEEDIITFFKSRSARSKQTIDKFINDVKALALLPGDFYVKKGRQVAAKAITSKINSLFSDLS